MKNFFLSIVLLTTFLCFFDNKIFAQTPDKNLLDIPIREISITEKDLPSTLMWISERYGVPIGFEFSNFENTTIININLNLKNTKVASVLNLLVQQNPNYTWEINDGVINFVPTKARNEAVKKLLLTKISKFSSEKVSDKYSLKSRLAELPEVKSLFSNPFTFKVSDSITVNERFSGNVLNTLENVQFRSILNQIIKVSESKFWMIKAIGSEEYNSLIILDF